LFAGVFALTDAELACYCREAASCRHLAQSRKKLQGLRMVALMARHHLNNLPNICGDAISGVSFRRRNQMYETIR
jgi:hypothetical protein